MFKIIGEEMVNKLDGFIRHVVESWDFEEKEFVLFNEDGGIELRIGKDGLYYFYMITMDGHDTPSDYLYLTPSDTLVDGLIHLTEMGEYHGLIEE